MARKMLVPSVVFLCLVSILGLCSATLTPSMESLESLQLTHAQVKSLCGAVSESRIDNDQLYQWINVQKEVEQKSKNACYKIGYTPCVGETRYPLTKDCGFFNMVPANEEECSKAGSIRSKRSVSMSHGEAKHLCHTFTTSDLPSSPDQINYVAVKIDVTNPEDKEVQLPHPAEACVAWAYKPCMSDNKVGCDEWDKIVKPTENCANFHSQDPAVHPQHPHRPKMDQRISGSSLAEMKDVISCKSVESTDGAITCQILPETTSFQLNTDVLDQSTSILSRQKRQWRRYGRGRGGRGCSCCCGAYACHCCC